MKCLDARRRQIQCGHQLRRNASDGSIDLLGGDPQPIGRQGQAIETLRVAQQRRVTVGPHIRDDRRHRLIDAFCGLARLPQQSGERSLEARIGGGEPYHCPNAARNRAIQAPIVSGCVFNAVRLTISRDVIGAITSVSTSPFARSVDTGLHQIDDQPRQPKPRRQLHRPVQVHHLGMHAARGEMPPRDVGIFRRHPHPRPARRIVASPRSPAGSATDTRHTPMPRSSGA